MPGAVYEARQTWRHVAEDLFVKAAGAGVFGYGSWLFASRPSDELGGGWVVVVVRLLGAVLAAAAVACAVEAVTRVTQAAGRQLVVRVDAEGVTLGPRWFWSAPVGVPWSAVDEVGLTGGTRPDRVRVCRRDGVVHRRRLDLRRLADPGRGAREMAGLAVALVELTPEAVTLAGVERPRRAA